VFPPAEPRQFDYQRVYDFYRQLILDGDLEPGQKLPPLREIAQRSQVSQGSAQRGIDLLASSKLVRTSRQGTFVLEPRDTLGPQEQLRSTRWSAAERTDSWAVEQLAPAGDLAYVAPILGLGHTVPPREVIRRQWRTLDATGPFRLTSAWVPAQFAALVPELLVPEPLPVPMGEAWLIAERTSQDITRGKSSREARRVRADAREAPALQLAPDGHVLAETFWWGGTHDILAYVEFITREGRVVVTDLVP
jgi:GntR family transcriptional regulator